MRPRRWVRRLDAIADGIIPTLNTVLRLMGSTPERPDPVRLYYLLYIVLLLAIAVTWEIYHYRT
jgi:hypothetical protein